MEIELERKTRHNINLQRRLLLAINNILVAAVMCAVSKHDALVVSVMNNGGMRVCMFAVGVVPCRGLTPCGCAARGVRPVSS